MEQSTAPKPFVFVLMPFDPKFNDIYKFGIKGAAADVGAYAERVDEQVFIEGILERIYNQINKADVIVADMTGRNENVFYEVGYAHALGKIVILLTQNADDIPFDLKHRQHLVYDGVIDKLRTELTDRLIWAIGESRRRGTQNVPERILLSVGETNIPACSSYETSAIIRARISDTHLTLPIDVRNGSIETSPEITHIYLFTCRGSELVPCKYKSQRNPDAPPFAADPYIDVPAPLISMSANFSDDQDIFVYQYRLKVKIPAMPPGAIERIGVPIMLIKGSKKVDDKRVESLFKIRIHTNDNHYDYTFSLSLSFNLPDA